MPRTANQSRLSLALTLAAAFIVLMAAFAALKATDSKTMTGEDIAAATAKNRENAEALKREYCGDRKDARVVSDRLDGGWRETYCVNDRNQKDGFYKLVALRRNGGVVFSGRFEKDKLVGTGTHVPLANVPLPEDFPQFCTCAPPAGPSPR